MMTPGLRESLLSNVLAFAPAPSMASSFNTTGTLAMTSSTQSQPFDCLDSASNNSINGGPAGSKRKRRPAGTPDPDAEVVSLSPKTLLESDRYVCEICGQGFQRDQNLQMHRRRHKVPWKLLKRETQEAKKRVFVCPEPSCLHHDPCHALGDLVGIKKHYRRKHSNHKQWVCGKCSKAYAVQSDYKAHLKTCGTRGHSCDCGRVFSRVESFIEHQDACHANRARKDLQASQPASLSRTASSPSPSSETKFHTAGWASSLHLPLSQSSLLLRHLDQPKSPVSELQLLPSTSSNVLSPVSHSAPSPESNDAHDAQLQLSIGSCVAMGPGRVEEEAQYQLKIAIADDARAQAARQMELAEQELADAKRIRQQAQAELHKAQLLREHAIKQINSTLLQITCQSCKHHFRAKAIVSADEHCMAVSYKSSVVADGTEDDNSNNTVQRGKIGSNP
ncbi:C2H2-like zinc finger protein isoform X2 [Wolffia australiana]